MSQRSTLERRVTIALVAFVMLVAACGSQSAQADESSLPETTAEQLMVQPTAAVAINPTPAAEAEAGAEAPTSAIQETPTPKPTLIVLPPSEKNQPVFRQAQADSDSRERPTIVRLRNEILTVAGAVSAFTDRIDVVAVARDPGSTNEAEVTVAWRCHEWFSEDGRSLQITVEDRGQLLAQGVCSDALPSGTAQVVLEPESELTLLIDSGEPAGGNFYAEYELTVRKRADGGEQAPTQPSTTPTPEPTADADSSPNTPTSTPEPTTTAAPEPTPTSSSSSAPLPTPTPSVEPPTVEPTPAPTPTAAPEPTPTPSSSSAPRPSPTPPASATPAPTATAEPAPSATPTPEPTARPFIPPADAGEDDEGPAAGSGDSAPDDGDSRVNPQRPGDPGFLIGSVSGPRGDSVDYSAFELRPGDPSTSFVALVCTDFSGSGTLAVTVSDGDDVVGELRCTFDQPEDFAELTLQEGPTYLVTAEFQGTGFVNWSFQGSDDD